jgi:hypothetical protein
MNERDRGDNNSPIELRINDKLNSSNLSAIKKESDQKSVSMNINALD